MKKKWVIDAHNMTYSFAICKKLLYIWPILSCYIPSYTMSCYFGLLEKLIKFLQLVKQGKERHINTVIYSINCSRDVFFSSVILKKTYGPQIQCVIRPAVLCDISGQQPFNFPRIIFHNFFIFFCFDQFLHRCLLCSISEKLFAPQFFPF